MKERGRELPLPGAQATERSAALHFLPGARLRPVLAGVDPRHALLRRRPGAVALALIVIPVVVRTTDDMLKLVPNSLREAAVALGCPTWKMIVLVTYRAARSGILTGILLAVARISGETAPLLFTALNNQFWSMDLNPPMSNLPTVIFQFAMSPYEDW